VTVTVTDSAVQYRDYTRFIYSLTQSDYHSIYALSNSAQAIRRYGYISSPSFMSPSSSDSVMFSGSVTA